MPILRWIAGVFSFTSLSALAAIGGVGLVVWLYEADLPDAEALARHKPPTLSRVFSPDGTLLGEYAREWRIFTPIEEMPDLVKNAFISAEDKNFHTHPGLDALGIVRAVVANARAIAEGDGGVQGASTITQQVIKNFLLTSDRSIERKVKEAILSVRIERALSKDRILEIYLNEIFLGQNAYGVAAAAQRYFGKSLEELTPPEAAYLASLPKAPSALHPVRDRRRAVWRRNYVLREMAQNGYLTRAEMQVAQAAPLRTLLDADAPPVGAADPGMPTYVTSEIRRRLGGRLGMDAIFEGGLTIRTTIDPELQRIGEAALRDALQAYDRRRDGWRGPIAILSAEALADPARRRAALAEVDAPRDIPGWRLAVASGVTDKGARFELEDGGSAVLPFPVVREWARPRRADERTGSRPRTTADLLSVGDVVHLGRGGEGWALRQTPLVSGAFMAIEVATGRILAMQGGFSWMTSPFNRATQAFRQPGSTFKPFVYAAAVEAGYAPETTIVDAPVAMPTPEGLWRPENASGGFIGPAPMRTGLRQSRNAMTVRLANALGMDRVAALAERLGVYEDMPQHPSYALGAGETTLERLLAAYAALANGGVRVEPALVDRVQDRHGETVWHRSTLACPGCDGVRFDGGPAPEPVGRATRILGREVAATMVSMLRGVVEEGTAARAFSDLDLPVAGKTGTTNEAKDVWFVGATPDIVAGCYIGYDEPKSLGEDAYGATLCAPVVADFFRAIYEEREPESFSAVAAKVAELVAEEDPRFLAAQAEADPRLASAVIGDLPEEPRRARVRAPSPVGPRGFENARGLY